jgi:hypothetical protein
MIPINYIISAPHYPLLFQPVGVGRQPPESIRAQVDAYVARRRAADPERFERKLLAISSFNALIRREFRAEHLSWPPGAATPCDLRVVIPAISEC